jgi:hypothetical protein
MKRKAIMITIVLAFFGCVLIGLSIYFFYQGNTNASEKIVKTKKELELANKKIEKLHQELEEKTIGIVDSQLKMEQFKSEAFNKLLGQNLPVVEITSTDIGEDGDYNEDNKKVHKLMYNHQVRFALLNIGKSSLKDVIFSIKDIYNDPKSKNTKKKSKGNSGETDEIGSYDNIEVNTLNLKSKKMVYTSNLPSSFGVGDYTYHVIVEWSQGFYQMQVAIEEIDGKLKFKYEFYDVNGREIDFKTLQTSINN